MLQQSSKIYTAREPDLYTNQGDKILFDVKKPFIYHVNIDKDDIDDQNHVNNVSYVKWMEQAAVSHSNTLGFDWQWYQGTGTSFFARRHEVEYLAQSYLDDEIVVATWPEKMEKFIAHRRYQIVRIRDGKTLVRALTHWVFVKTENERPTRIPNQMIEYFLQSVR